VDRVICPRAIEWNVDERNLTPVNESMPNVVHPFQLDQTDSLELVQCLPDGDGFKVIGPADFPSFLPATLTAKFDSATRIISGSAGDGPVILYNFRRIDGSDVDEHPFGAMVVSGTTAISSSFLDHGHWPNTQRTTPISLEHANYISASGIGGYFLQHPPGGMLSGSLTDLQPSDQDAFSQFIRSALNPSA